LSESFFRKIKIPINFSIEFFDAMNILNVRSIQ